MKAEDCYEGQTVFWPGLRWFRGRPEPFVREGIILRMLSQGKVKVQCAGDGPSLTKRRSALYRSRDQAVEKMVNMLEK